jgi:hypothetical protein
MAERGTDLGGTSQRAIARRKARQSKLSTSLVNTHTRRSIKRVPDLYGTDSSDTDPAEILLQEIRRTAGHIEWLRSQIQLSDPDTFVRSLWLVRRQSGYVNPNEIDLSAFSDAGALWVDLYLQERRHLAAICRTALAAGIEERRVRLAERQAENLGRAVRGMLYDLGLDPEADEVRSIVYRWLVAASTGDVDDTTNRPTLLPVEGAAESGTTRRP